MKIYVILTVIMCSLHMVAMARPDSTVSGSWSAGALFDTVVDGYGQKYMLGQISTDDAVRAAFPVPGASSLASSLGGGGIGTGGPGLLSPGPSSSFTIAVPSSFCNSGYFQMFVESGCGMEYFDPSDPLYDPAHRDRLLVICQVLKDISDFIESPLTTSGQKVNIWIRAGSPSDPVGLGQPFFSIPAFNTYSSGIADNLAWITLNSGQDAMSGVVSPLSLSGGGGTGSTFFHGAIKFNFGAATVNTDLTRAPTSSEVDLYTVALHEMMHTLGFASVISASGESIFTIGYKYYSRYDTHLRTQGSSSQHLIVQAPGSCGGMYQWTFNPAISPLLSVMAATGDLCGGSPPNHTTCATAIEYAGSVTQKVHTPDCFKYGTSLSHFEDECLAPTHPFVIGHPSMPDYNDQYFVMSNAGAYGVYDPATFTSSMKRQLSPEERSVLCDIGYRVRAEFGNAVNLNHVTYSDVLSCGQVAGINDGISAAGIYTLVATPGIPLSINGSGRSILDNDNATAFKCLELVNGSTMVPGTVSVTAGDVHTNVTFTSMATYSGVAALRYIPINAAGDEGNITYVIIYFNGGSCGSASDCSEEIVNNGGFENTRGGTEAMFITTSCWEEFSGSADLFTRCNPISGRELPSYRFSHTPVGGMPEHQYGGANNDHYVGMACGRDHSIFFSESIKQRLRAGLVNGNTYTIGFWGILGDIAYYAQPMQLQIGVSNAGLVAALPYVMLTTPSVITTTNVFTISKPDDKWHYYTQTFTYTGPSGADMLFVLPSPWLNPATYPAEYLYYFIIDDISIRASSDVVALSLPATIDMCPSSPAHYDLNSFLPPGAPAGTWHWETLPISADSIASVSHSNIFDHDAAYEASVATGNNGIVTVCYSYNEGTDCEQKVCSEIQIIPPQFSVAVSPYPVCSGTVVTLNCTVASSFTVTPSFSFSPSATCLNADCSIATVTPAATAIYSVTETVSGCTATTTVTVAPTPPAIGGADWICTGSSSTFTDAYAGGTWSSSDLAIGTIDAVSGIMNGISRGTVTITYTATICSTPTFTTKVVTVQPLPIESATGSFEVCAGSTLALSHPFDHGTWSSSGVGFAGGVDPITGVLTPYHDLTSVATMTVTYTLNCGGCYATQVVTIDPVPIPIYASSLSICSGVGMLVSCATPGGTWSNSDPLVATLDPVSGLVVGVSSGTTTISYTISSGCASSVVVSVDPLPGPITGPAAICNMGGVYTFSNSASGGTWALSSSSVAAIMTTSPPGTCSISGLSTGTTILTYSLCGLDVTHTFTVDPSPDAIAGVAMVYTSHTTDLDCTTPGGIWSISATSVATINALTGVVSGLSAGTAIVTYAAIGCYSTRVVTVIPVGDGILGPSAVCSTPVTYTVLVPGGTWSSSDIAVATVDAAGTVTGVSSGTATISYAMISGYIATKTITVNPSPSGIASILPVCSLGTTMLHTSDGSTGGTWSISSVSIGTIDASGMLTGYTVGTAVITYTLPDGCYSVATVTVAPVPALYGTDIVCEGATIAPVVTVAGGTWVSGDVLVATVGSASGIITGIGAGTAAISYTTAAGCTATMTVTVNPRPSAITGSVPVCNYGTLTLHDVTAGGTWVSSYPGMAAIDASGVVTAGAPYGTTTITYTIGTGCFATTEITVNPVPGTIFGAAVICEGATTMLTCDPGGTWSSSAPAIASIDASGDVTGSSPGIATMTYTLGTGCYSTKEVTVTPLPGAVTGTMEVCEGATTMLSNATAGGTWSSDNGVIANFTSGGTLGGVSRGTVTITYTIPGVGCHATAVVTVNGVPAPIGGSIYLCEAALTVLYSADAGGTWTSSDAAVAVIGSSTGALEALIPGTSTITYQMGTGCYRTEVVTVNPLPGAISGASDICMSTTTTLTCTPAGGTWTSGISPIASIDLLTGVVTAGLTGATTPITYRLATGCSVTSTITVHTMPLPIDGMITTCVGNETPASIISFEEGVWSSGDETIATVGSSSGMVAGVGAGTAIISYSTGGACHRTTIVTIDPAPAAITGLLEMCAGGTTTLACTTPGGTWISSDPAVASVDMTTGDVAGIAPGTTDILYTLGAGCHVAASVTVHATPSGIYGPTTLCEGSFALLSADAGMAGSWTSSDEGVISIDETGHIVGISAGTATITFATAPACYVTAVVTVQPIPAAVTGTLRICTGSATTLSDVTPDGSWMSSEPGIASVDDVTGEVTGVSAGTVEILYVHSVTGCSRAAIVTVDPVPDMITGVFHLCEGATSMFADAAADGIWSSSALPVLTIDAAGMVTGISAGTATISYTIPGAGCFATASVTVNAVPAPITGSLSICHGHTGILNDATPGGTWSSAYPAIADIATDGTVTGYTAGATTISYTVSVPECAATATIDVYPAIGPITGVFTLCEGGSTLLGSLTADNYWSSSAPTIATIDAAGLVTAVAAGTATISYAFPGTVCNVTAVVTVYPLPAAITGTLSLCNGHTTTLNSTTAGGTWSSSPTLIASVDAAGVVTGITPGTATVSYMLSSGCMATVIVTVQAAPASITGAMVVCAGAATALSSLTSGGTWSSSTPSVGTVDASGVVTGIASGVTMISYSISSGCSVTAAITVNALPYISSPLTVCVGEMRTMSGSGGTWSISGTTIATVHPTLGQVTGIAAGTTTITYTDGATGCYMTPVLTVNVMPAPITGSVPVCMGSTITLTSATAGGTWYCYTSESIAAISETGVVTGINVGTALISYSLGGGCVSYEVVTVNATPGIFGDPHICVGSTTTLTTALAGSAWSGGSAGIATISAAGVVSGISPGTAVITCTAPTAGCYVTVVVTVDPLPAAITGLASICRGNTTTLSCTTPGGAWISGDITVATIGASGIATGIAAGTALISYVSGSTHCVRTVVLTVNPTPAPIGAPSSVCEGSTATLSTAPSGGTWDVLPMVVGAAATISSAGVLTGMLAGSVIVYYILPSGCLTSAVVAIADTPEVISGTTPLCAGATAVFTDPDAGGHWGSGNTSIATVVPTGPFAGTVTGVAAGSVTISYTLPAGCATSFSLTIHPVPTAITGAGTVCAGNTITAASTPSGGTWSISDPSIATIDPATGVVSGIAAGTAVITYGFSTLCHATSVVTVQPAASAISGYNAICVGGIITMSNATPGGTWSSSGVHAIINASTGVVSPISAGIEVITYTVSYGCYSQYKISVFRYTDNSCSPCAPRVFGTTHNFNTLGLSTSISESAIPAGNYYLPNSVTVDNNVTITDAVIFVAPGAAIMVTPDHALTSRSSHFFGCKDMWKGIVLQSASGHTGRLELLGNTIGTRSTLIEDAFTAVTVESPIQPNPGGPYFIDSRNTVFNRNHTGIYISNYTPASSSLPGTPEVYEFRIENTTFTCRSLEVAGYPFTWPSNYSLSGPLKGQHYVPTFYESPYNAGLYGYTPCRNGQPAYAGIRLDKVGNTSGAVYAGIKIGEPAPSAFLFGALNLQWNLFDALGFGIRAVNSNVTVQNNRFQNTKQTEFRTTSHPVIDQAAIYTNMDDGNRYKLNVTPVVSGYGIFSVSATNSFYDCRLGVYSNGYTNILCEGSDMRGTQTMPVDAFTRCGFLMLSSSYEDIKVNNNRIFNIANGILFTSTFGAGHLVDVGGGLFLWVPETQRLGNIEINSNRIQATNAPTLGPPTTQYLSLGIAVQNELPGGSFTVPAGNVNTNANVIRDAHRGILVSGYRTQSAFTFNNDITIRSYKDQTGYGISHVNNDQSRVVSNKVALSATASPNDPYNESLRGYKLDANTSPWVACNTSKGMALGFEFYDLNYGTQWKNNDMDQHMKGLVLNKAAIGPQGNTSMPYNNAWVNPSWWAGNYHTYVIGTPSAASSPLYVQASAVYMPSVNAATSPGLEYSASGTPPSIIPASGLVPSDCPIDHNTSNHALLRGSGYEPPVKLTEDHNMFVDARQWTGQFMTWQTLLRDTELADSSALLARFKAMAAGSRMAYLTDLEVTISNGDISGAESLLANTPPALDPALCIDTATGIYIKDDSTVDHIIDAHKLLYTVYLRYLQRTMTADDSVLLAQAVKLCPLEYGPVIYRARVLYTAVYNEVPFWEDTCPDSPSSGDTAGRPALIRALASDDGRQLYALYPNPNDGDITISQAVADPGVIAIEVTDMLGRSVYSNDVRFKDRHYRIMLNDLTPGVYLMQIRDSIGRRYNYTFVKER